MYLGWSIAILLSLMSFTQAAPKENWLGLLGHTMAWGLHYLFGFSAFLIPVYLGWIGGMFILQKPIQHFRLKTISFFILMLCLSILLSMVAEGQPRIAAFFEDCVYSGYCRTSSSSPSLQLRHFLGGVPFYHLYADLTPYHLSHLFGRVGTFLIFFMLGLASALFLTNMTLAPLVALAKKGILQLLEKIKRRRRQKEEEQVLFETTKNVPAQPFAGISEKAEELSLSRQHPLLSIKPAPPLTNSPPSPPKKAEPRLEIKEKEKDREEKKEEKNFIFIPPPPSPEFSHYKLPTADLLTQVKKIDSSALMDGLRKQAGVLEETLLSFGIEAKVGDIHCGPTITMFEVHPAIGVKVQKIKALENDIALNMQAKSIRIIAPIPGKAAVGIEVPNPYPQEVSFRELIENYQSGAKKAHIPLLLGKVVNGDDVWADLTKMPHCIIAGATGSGKSVCINTIVMSILMNARPDEIKLVMVDPKKVELTAYSRLPHMLAPVITEPGEAHAALNWLVREMERRYEIFRRLGIRNILGFNSRQINAELESSLEISIPERLPYIVVIVDELADLMMVSSSDIETPIARIAQMARAVGIHLLLATQRPSREVITGLIKANFPTRIAFKVSSRVNSQIIIDENGAESLLGNGDMLFMPPGTSTLVRAQGAFIRDDDINRVIDFICEQAPTQYLIPSFSQFREQNDERESDREETSSSDPLYEEAKNLVLETGTASTTFLQRKLKIGYARAASLMDELENNGIIGPQEGAKPRKIFYPTPSQENEADDLDLE